MIAVAALAFARSIFPTPIIERATKAPYQNQLVARLCYAGIGVFLLLVWWGIYSEGRNFH